MGFMEQHLEAIDAAGTTDVADIMGMPIVVVTMTGARTGQPRRIPLMRVEHEGTWLAVASAGGAPKDPGWRPNLDANPDVLVQDGAETHERRARRLSGDERATWWERAVAAYPPYADYQEKTDREIPIYAIEPR